VDYIETFSPVARLNSIQIMFSVVNMELSLFQLDVKNAFLKDLKEDVYMEQPSGYVVQGKNIVGDSKRRFMDSNRVEKHGLKIQHSYLWYWLCSLSFRSFGLCSSYQVWFSDLIVYVDDILLIRSDSPTLAEIKEYLKCHFVTKNTRKPKYFLEIETA